MVAAWELIRLALMVVLVLSYWSTNPLNGVNLLWLGAGWSVLTLVLIAIARRPDRLDVLKPIAVIGLTAALATDVVVIGTGSAGFTPLLAGGPVAVSPLVRFYAVMGVLVVDVLAAAFLVSLRGGEHAAPDPPERPRYQETHIEGE